MLMPSKATAIHIFIKIISAWEKCGGEPVKRIYRKWDKKCRFS
jgi:hypothetical protein